MPNYANGKIYQIISPSHPEAVYYGSTTQPLCVRMACHRSNYKRLGSLAGSSHQVIQHDDAQIVLVEAWPCQSHEELTQREIHYIRSSPCVNRNLKRTEEMRKKEQQAKDKAHYEKIRQNSSHVSCPCGSKFYQHLQSHHERTKRHQKFQASGVIYESKHGRIACDCGGWTYRSPSIHAKHLASKKHQDFLASHQ